MFPGQRSKVRHRQPGPQDSEQLYYGYELGEGGITVPVIQGVYRLQQQRDAIQQSIISNKPRYLEPLDHETDADLWVC